MLRKHLKAIIIGCFSAAAALTAISTAAQTTTVLAQEQPASVKNQAGLMADTTLIYYYDSYFQTEAEFRQWLLDTGIWNGVDEIIVRDSNQGWYDGWQDPGIISPDNTQDVTVSTWDVRRELDDTAFTEGDRTFMKLSYSVNGEKVLCMYDRDYATYYMLTGSGYALVGMDSWYTDKTTITMPDSIQGTPVTAVHDNFSSSTWYIETLVLGRNVTSMGKNTASNETKVVFNDKLETIADSAFSSNTVMEEIVLPASVKSIGKSAFSGASAKKIDISATQIKKLPASLCSNCIQLTAFKAPAGVTSIGEYAFYDCRKLTDLPLTEKVTSIGDMAFYNCDSVKQLTLPTKLKSVKMNAFCDMDGITSINIKGGKYNNGYVFRDCKNIKSAKIEGVPSIPIGLFSGCEKLETITIGAGVKKIKSNAFSNLPALYKVVIPKTVKSFENGIFNGCDLMSLTVQVPKSSPMYKNLYATNEVAVTNSTKKAITMYTNSMFAGEYRTVLAINHKNVSIKSSNEKVVKVYGNALYALKTGKAKITVTASGKKYTYNVSVVADTPENRKSICYKQYVRSGMTNFEKICMAQAFLVKNVHYDNKTANHQAGANPNAHSALGAWQGRAVCDGYSKAYQEILNHEGIQCEVLSAYIMNHAWNLVNLDGSWYHVDVTFADPVMMFDENAANMDIHLGYLLLNDADMRATGHIWPDTYRKCTKKSYLKQ